MADYINGLRDHYPTMPPDAEVDIITFHVESEPARTTQTGQDWSPQPQGKPVDEAEDAWAGTSTH
jgi:hypothetical protein